MLTTRHNSSHSEKEDADMATRKSSSGARRAPKGTDSRGGGARSKQAGHSRERQSEGEEREGQDAISLLLDDHDKVRELLSQLEETDNEDADDRRSLLQQIEHEIQVHSKVEEKIFYPAFKKAVTEEDGQKLFHEATEEHHVVDMVLPELKRVDPATDEFAGKAKVLKDLIEHHAEEEEREMFPAAREALGEDELVRLGEEIQEMKRKIS
jgi:hemerythrin-like domain-containing protein